MTTAEYFKTPETVRPQELVYGVVRAADSPLPIHQRAVLALTRALDVHVREGGLGEVWVSPLDVVLDFERALVVQPDLFFVSTERSGIVSDRVRGAPDLVVEVLSPNPRIGYLDERIGWFARYGVRECWLLHQFERRLDVLSFADGAIRRRLTFEADEPIRSTVLPRFTETLDTMLGWVR